MKRLTTLMLVSAVAAVCILHTASSQRLAFPTAEGYGKYAAGGRGGRVIEVTNLDDDTNPGSLRYAVNQSGARTVVFRVSGTITLVSSLNIRNPYITIAGQTAPGDGICVKKYPVIVQADHVVIRYLRVRLGDEAGIESDAMEGHKTGKRNIIFDHCSVSWSVDETLSPYGNDSLTIQWCLVSESLYNSNHAKGAHGYGGIWGGNRNTFHHNLLAHHSSRNPRFASGAGLNDFRNNVVYNWGFNSTYGGEAKDPSDSATYGFFNVNMVANFYKAGPATKSGVRFKICGPSSRNGAYDCGKWYVADNVVHGSAAVTENNWNGGVLADAGLTQAMLKADQPFATMPIRQETAELAYLSVLASAGASLPKRDTVDARIVNDVRTGTATYEGLTYRKNQGFPAAAPVTGIIDTQTDVGGWPVLQSLPAPADADHDGMPDAWEASHGLNAADPADRNAVGTDGYTMLEAYLNGITGSISTGVEPERARPSSCSLNQNYPNPFNPSTMLSFTVPETGYTRLTVTDVLGREVATLYAGEAVAGAVVSAMFEGAARASGVYLARLSHGGRIEARKMLFAK